MSQVFPPPTKTYRTPDDLSPGDIIQIGGTEWVYASKDNEGAFPYLFVHGALARYYSADEIKALASTGHLKSLVWAGVKFVGDTPVSRGVDAVTGKEAAK